MAKSLTTTSHAILGLLSIQPCSTYELATQIERSLGWFWPRTGRKIYDEAKRLVETGHASARQQGTGARPRTVYRITAKGRRTLARWLEQPSEPPKLESEALVRVFFANAGTLDGLHTTLDGCAASATANIDRLTRMIEAADRDDYRYTARRHINAVAIRFQLDYHRMVVQWAQWARQQTDDWHDANDPGDWDWHDAIE